MSPEGSLVMGSSFLWQNIFPNPPFSSQGKGRGYLQQLLGKFAWRNFRCVGHVMAHNCFYKCWARRRRTLHCARVLKEGKSVEGTFVYPWVILGPGEAILSSCFSFHSHKPLICPQVTRGLEGWVSGKDGSIIRDTNMLLSYLWLPSPFFFLPLSSVNSRPKHDLGFTLKSMVICKLSQSRHCL